MAEAVAQGEHSMFLIVEAADEGRLREFMQPVPDGGSLDIYRPRRACAQWRAVARAPSSGAGVPTLDLEEACQKAIDAGMVMHRARPQLRDVPCGARGRRRHAECAVLHAQQLAHARSRRRDLPARDRRPRRAVAELHDSRSPEHAIEDARRHAGVRRQRPARCSIRPPRERNGGWVPSARRNGPECRSSRSLTAPGCGRKQRRSCFAAPIGGRRVAPEAVRFERSLDRRCARRAMCSSPTR